MLTSRPCRGCFVRDRSPRYAHFVLMRPSFGHSGSEGIQPPDLFPSLPFRFAKQSPKLRSLCCGHPFIGIHIVIHLRRFVFWERNNGKQDQLSNLFRRGQNFPTRIGCPLLEMWFDTFEIVETYNMRRNIQMWFMTHCSSHEPIFPMVP